MYGQPGKKLLFQGCEFAQGREWNFESKNRLLIYTRDGGTCTQTLES